MNFSDAVLTKARKLVGAGRLHRDEDHPDIWWVASSAGSKSYRVQSDFDPATRELSYITCTCPHGLNTGAGAAFCYHVAGVLMKLRDEQTVAGVAPDVIMGGQIGPRREESE